MNSEQPAIVLKKKLLNSDDELQNPSDAVRDENKINQSFSFLSSKQSFTEKSGGAAVLYGGDYNSTDEVSSSGFKWPEL